MNYFFKYIIVFIYLEATTKHGWNKPCSLVAKKRQKKTPCCEYNRLGRFTQSVYFL